MEQSCGRESINEVGRAALQMRQINQIIKILPFPVTVKTAFFFCDIHFTDMLKSCICELGISLSPLVSDANYNMINAPICCLLNKLELSFQLVGLGYSVLIYLLYFMPPDISIVCLFWVKVPKRSFKY